MSTRAEIVLERQRDNIVALLGDAINGWLAEPSVTDVTLNPPLSGETHGRLWVARLGRDREPVGFMDPDQALRLIGAVAASMGKELTVDTPSVEGVLITDGSRFTGFAAPLTAAPCFSIRRRASAVFPFAQYVADGKMTERQQTILEDAVAHRLNTIIVGSTGAGKSTLLNAFIRSMTEITPYHRFVILEDTAELQCAAPDQTIMQTTARLGLRELLKLGLRSFPDRIIIGETRDGSMLDILQAWNTGHPGGATTLHSDTATPVQALERVEDLVMQAVPNPMHRMIARTVNLIVCMQIERGVRRVSQIASVRGHDGQNYLIEQEA